MELALQGSGSAGREADLRTLAFDHLVEPTLLLDPHADQIVDANPAACTLLGYDRAALRQTKLTALHAGQIPQLIVFTQAVMAKADDDPALRGMGTTIVALAAVVTDGEDRIAVVNVGDSRCYLLEEDRLRQITKDHSVVQTLVDNGQITRAEAERHPQRNILTRALGIDPRVMSDSWELLPFAGQSAALITDVAPAAEIMRRIMAEAEAALRHGAEGLR